MFDESIINDEPIDLNAIIPKNQIIDEPIDLNAIIPKNQIIDEQIDLNKPEETPKKRKGKTTKKETVK